MAFCDNKYCTKCKLHTKAAHPGLMGRGNKESGVLIIGDFPTKFEDEQGNVFLGKHGKFIQDRLDLVGLDPYFLYAIKCPIIGEKKSTTPAQRACCTPFTIKVIEEIKPKVIVTLGQVPMQQLLGMSYSTKVLRGKAFFFPELNAYVVPTYQPKGIIFESDSLLFTQFREDLELARSILSNPPKRKVVPQLKSLSDPISIKEYLLSLFQAEDVVIDLETNGLDSRESRITDISFSSRTNEGIHIKWEDLMEFYDIFKDFLASDIMKCFHNAAFDREMLYMAGFTNIKNIGYDTMLAFHTTNMSFEGKEQQGLYKLKTMAWFTSEHGGYESILEEEGGIAGIQGIKAKKEEKPKKLPYFWINEASKTFGEFRLKKDLSDLLKKDKECKEVQQEEFEAFKKEHAIPTVFNRLERKEPVVDWDYYNNLIRERRKARMEKTGLDKLPYYAAMDALVTREAMKYTKPEIDAQYKSIFYDHIMPLNYVLSRMRINGIRLDKEYMEGIKKENEKRAEECKQEFFKAVGKEINLGSSPQIQELLFKEMRIKPHPNYVSAVTKKPSANEEAILYYSEQYPELKLILDYRGIVKETSTYIDGFLSEIHPQTGRVHPSYLQNSTATGRLSCIAEGTKISCVGENKNIEDIKIGDLVYCYDDLGNKKTSKVKNVFDNGIRKCIELYIQDELGYEYKLICTPDHKIKTTYGWISAENITNFNSIYFSGGLYTLKKVIKKAVNKLQVYDLEIEQYHNFIANEICVHNCIAPAMQTIPKDNRIRNMVVPTEGWRLVSADLSQAELRVLAQMSNDDAMIAAFLSGKDLHAVTACRAILGIDVDAFDKSIPEHKYARDISKTINFGIVYGMSSYTLAIRLGMPMNDEAQKRKSMQEAQMYIDKWFALYSGAKAWLDGIQEYCKRYGYVESLFGRRRYLHDIWSSDPSKAGGACRQAMNCVDEETEALTQRGWLKYNEISLEDILLTKNKDTGELEWQNVRALNIFPDYEGTIIEFNSKSFSAVTTPNHRWLIDSNYEGNTKIVTSDNLSVCGHHKIHRTGKYVKQSTMYSDDFIELVGWVLTDGHFKESTTYNNSGVSIIQSNRAKPYNVKLIEDLLQRLDLKVYKQFDTVTECYNWSFWGEVPKKIKTLFPERKLNISFIKDISSTQAILLLETMLRGDGTVELPRGNQQGKRVFYTRHEDVAGVFQILCTMCGYSSNYRWRASYPKPYTSPKLRQPILNSKGVYVVNISWRSKAQVVPHQKKEYFDKKLMWCPSVDNTFFVARRNGTVYITGNSPIQSTASDITCTGLIRMQRFLDENPKYRSMIVGVIHDDILVDTPVEEVEDISKKLTECMTQDIPGIKLPLVADPSIHERWTKE